MNTGGFFALPFAASHGMGGGFAPLPPPHRQFTDSARIPVGTRAAASRYAAYSALVVVWLAPCFAFAAHCTQHLLLNDATTAYIRRPMPFHTHTSQHLTHLPVSYLFPTLFPASDSGRALPLFYHVKPSSVSTFSFPSIHTMY